MVKVSYSSPGTSGTKPQCGSFLIFQIIIFYLDRLKVPNQILQCFLGVNEVLRFYRPSIHIVFFCEGIYFLIIGKNKPESAPFRVTPVQFFFVRDKICRVIHVFRIHVLLFGFECPISGTP